MTLAGRDCLHNQQLTPATGQWKHKTLQSLLVSDQLHPLSKGCTWDSQFTEVQNQSFEFFRVICGILEIYTHLLKRVKCVQ